ncbi:11237_t:CDS:1, partial [Entrophospora sp. SA101]
EMKLLDEKFVKPDKKKKALDSDFPKLAAAAFPTAKKEHLQLFSDYMP